MHLIKKIENRIFGALDAKRRKIFYSRFINSQDLVFDIGANCGNRTSVFLSIGAEVIAIEPNPKLANYLSRKFGTKATIVPKAVGNKNGSIDLYINDTDVLSTTSQKWINAVKESSRFGDLVNNFSNKVEVEMTTLNDLTNIYKTPKFVKIDVEGVEIDVVKNIKNSSIQIISFEFAIPESLEDTLNILVHLNNVGYKFFNISFGESMEFLTNKKLSLKQINNLLHNLPTMSWGDIYVFSKN